MVDAPSSSLIVAELAERHALAGRREDADVGDVFDRPAEGLLIADGQVIALFADQNLADGFAADGGFHGILHIADVDAEAIGGGAIDDQIHVRLAAHLKCAEIGDAGNLAHDVLNLVRLWLRAVFRSPPKSLTASSPLTPLTASSTLSEIGCEKFQSTPGNLLQFLVHGGDEIVFCFELGAPLRSREQIDEEFRVVKAAGVAAVVGTADLADDLLDLGEIGQHSAALCLASAMPAVGPVLGASVPRTQIAPSSRCGKNSEPIIPLNARNNMRRERGHSQAKRELHVVEAPVERRP